MAKIDTREGLIAYIRRRLGEPVITVELTDDQIDDIIDEVIEKFSEFAYDGQDIKYMLVPIFSGVKEYKLDSRISAILDLRTTQTTVSIGMLVPAGYSADISQIPSVMKMNDFETSLVAMSRYESLFDVRPAYTYNSNNSVLTFHQHIQGNALIEASLEYEPGNVDGIYGHTWIKDMCVAQSKYQWGNNIGKYSGTLINGNTINYSDIKSDGQQDIERLNEELLTRWSPPLGITVG